MRKKEENNEDRLRSCNERRIKIYQLRSAFFLISELCCSMYCFVSIVCSMYCLCANVYYCHLVSTQV